MPNLVNDMTESSSQSRETNVNPIDETENMIPESGSSQSSMFDEYRDHTKRQYTVKVSRSTENNS